MDPVSHLLFGRTVALALTGRARRDRAPRHGPTATVADARTDQAARSIGVALLLGSILPDIDAVLAPRRFDLYLLVHASGTHSLAGSAGEAIALALALTLIGPGGVRLVPLIAASWLGIAGHIFWDLADGSDISMLEPFSRSIFGWHLVAMGEPLVVGVLAAAVIGSWYRPTLARRMAIHGLAALSIVLLVKAGSQWAARAAYAQSIPGRAAPSAVLVAPVLGSLSEWRVYDRVHDRVQAWNVSVLSGSVTLAFEQADAPAGPLIASSLAVPAVRELLARAGIPFARIETEAGRPLVLWSDIRTCSAAGCDLSFGALFDSTQAPLYQVVRIGGFQQVRPVGTVRASGSGH
jgi:hypothetical protein